MATYDYDSWGNIVDDHNYANFAGKAIKDLNPFRYRGYYYDAETWFYYLQSRYYDPAIGRFINADALASTGQGFNGHNMYAYCGNNPIARKDATGNAWITVVVVGAILLISGVSNAVPVARQGGSAWECIGAGLVGAAGGGVGMWIASAIKDPFIGSVLGRMASSVVTDVCTPFVVNGEFTEQDAGTLVVDVALDFSLSCPGYYHNPMADGLAKNIVNATIDGLVDYAETEFLYSGYAVSSSGHASYSPAGRVTMARL